MLRFLLNVLWFVLGGFVMGLGWWLAFQLLSAYGLRTKELQHLEQRGGRLWCTYEKVASR